MKRIKKIRAASKRSNALTLAVFLMAFAGIGGLIVLRSRAAVGNCSTADVVGSVTQTVSAPEAAQYRLWVRMQVPGTSNTNNLNGVRVELAGSSTQCFTVTTTATGAVNAWQWVGSDATAASTPHITAQLAAGNYTARILGLKAGVKVDKIMLIRSDSQCVPSNDFSTGQPGANCTVPAPTITLTAAPNTVLTGTGTTLNWNSTNATSCTAGGSWSGNREPNGSEATGTLTANQTYTLVCDGPGGRSATATASVTVSVTPPPDDSTPPSVSMVLPAGVNLDGNNTARVTSMRSVTWQPVAGDASGIRSLMATVNGQAVTLTNGTYTFGGNSGGNGDYILRVVATDNNDNVTESTATIRLRHPDFNRNGIVNQFEATSIMNAWGTTNNRYDINLDGIIGSYELTYILNKWNSTQ